jgi:hypothetical protein
LLFKINFKDGKISSHLRLVTKTGKAFFWSWWLEWWTRGSHSMIVATSISISRTKTIEKKKSTVALRAIQEHGDNFEISFFSLSLLNFRDTCMNMSWSLWSNLLTFADKGKHAWVSFKLLDSFHMHISMAPSYFGWHEGNHSPSNSFLR